MDKNEKSAVLQELGGISEEIYNDIGKEFIGIARTRLAELKKAAENGNVVQIREIAHALKGSSANLRLKTLQGIALGIEEAVKAGDLKAVPGLIQKAEEALPDAEKNFELFGI